MTRTAPPKRFHTIFAATALLLTCAFAAATVVTVLSPSPAFAKNGNSNGNGNGGGNGNGNSGGNGNGNGNAGGNGNGNAGGNGNGNGNGNSGGGGGGGGNGSGGSAGGNNGSAGASSPGQSPSGETEIVDPNSALNLRETGRIKSLDEVYGAAERQLGGKVIDAKLVMNERQGLAYDLRVVTQDGHVRKARYDATSLALLSLDDRPVE